MKRCSLCRELKPLSDFNRSRKYKDGLNCRCRSCHNISNAISRKKIAAKNEFYYRERWLKYFPGIGDIRAEFVILKALQTKKDGLHCAICNYTPVSECIKDILVVDHDHETIKLRGLLCHYCNRALGFFKDNIFTLKNTIEYLENSNYLDIELSSDDIKYKYHSKEYYRNQNLKYAFNITLKAYGMILEQQNSRCILCGVHQSEQKRAFAVDHDHRCCTTNKPNTRTCGKCIRGLLCELCNRGIGQFKEDIDCIRKSISYLENPPGYNLYRQEI